jgi:hypothetical protein
MEVKMELEQKELERPINHRAKWSITEVEILLEEVKSGLSFEIIAENHHRTVGAIKYKLYRYIIQLLKKEPNLKIDDLVKITSLTKEEIISGLQKLNYNYHDNYNYDNHKNKNKDNHDNNYMKIIGKILLFQISIYGCLYIYQKYFMQV